MSNEFCFECGREGETQSHHVVPRSLGGTKTVQLCLSCHSKCHGKRMAHKELTLIGQEKVKALGMRYGSIPHGFRDEGGKLVRDEKESEAVRIAREMYPHFTLRRIADELYERGFLNRRGKKFNQNSINSMCRDLKR